MLSIGKLAPGQQQYYLDTVARGAEEYYTGTKEAPGEWIGSAATRLGLGGQVDAADLHDVLVGLDPSTGRPLARAQGAPSVPGFDATFCAPKSVSLLFALGDPETSNQVRNAHDTAVAAALRAFESVAARARRGKGGLERIEADGFVAAAFRHRTSRAGDPHLHTHVVVANLVHAPSDDRWSALDARPFYGWAKTIGYLYEAQLRSELTRRLGVDWRPVRNGIADIAGMPDGALRAFSRRRQAIEAHLDEIGAISARAAQVAAYATREAKSAGLTPEASPAEWRQRGHDHGLDARTIDGTLDRAMPAQTPSVGTDRAAALFARLGSADGVTAQQSTFGRREVLRAVAEALPAGADIAAIIELADAFLASRHVVALPQARGLRTPDVIRRRDGVIVASRTDEALWTTAEVLDVEARVVRNAMGRQDDHVGIANSAAVQAELTARPSLTQEQVRLVRRLTGSGAGVEVVEGAAGTGKTYALAAAHHAWQTSGFRVTGCSLAARAVAELEVGAGIPSETIHRLLERLDNPARPGFAPGDVVVVDEAAMVGTRTLARLLDHASTGRAKVVLVGDHHQLTEIDAGGAFAGLARRLGATRLNDNRRQVAEWERRALARLRAGVVDRALADYRFHNRIHVVPDADAARHQLVGDWMKARGHGRQATMLAARTRDVDELNRIARQRLQATGQLGSDAINIASRGFAIGDEAIATRNAYELGVLNGTRATITEIDQRDGIVRGRTEDGAAVVLPRDYVAAGHLTHAYATTFHKAQGTTVDETFVLVRDGLDREYAYSGLSRGALANSLYLSEGLERLEERHAPEVELAPTERLARRLAVSNAKTMAIDLNDGIGLGL
jgi:conjugative relaxase-like TrwC/TraI family protein